MRWTVDTNVLVRLLVRDDDDQHAAALARLQRAETAGDTWYVSAVAIAETAWMLGRVYRYPRAQVAAAIDGLLAARAVEVESASVVLAALVAYREGQADFPDYLIVEAGKAARANRTLTFDRRLLARADCEAP